METNKEWLSFNNMDIKISAIVSIGWDAQPKHGAINLIDGSYCLFSMEAAAQVAAALGLQLPNRDDLPKGGLQG